MDILKLHLFFNKLYGIAAALEMELAKNGLKSSRGSYHKHYFRTKKEWQRQEYYVPVISVGKRGDIGVNIDGVFFEVDTPSAWLSKERLKKIIKSFRKVEIYGFDHCLQGFYPSRSTLDDIFLEVKRSREKTIQFSLGFPLSTPPREVVRHFIKFTSALGK